MERIVNCIAHRSSEGCLLVGDDKTALIDCGMAFCADATINNVKRALGQKPLDYILFSHTHYDHIGALPWFLKEWPQVKVVTSVIGAEVLKKDTPRRVIRELSVTAANIYGTKIDVDYDDELFCAGIMVKEKAIIELGNLTLEVIESPGHTRDSLSFFVLESGTLILSETLGALMPDDQVYPCYLSSYKDTIGTIEKCRSKPFTLLSLPHRGVVNEEVSKTFFDKAMAANVECFNFIAGLKDINISEEEILERYINRNGSDMLFTYQPKEAFLLNARATVSCTLRELSEKN